MGLSLLSRGGLHLYNSEFRQKQLHKNNFIPSEQIVSTIGTDMPTLLN